MEVVDQGGDQGGVEMILTEATNVTKITKRTKRKRRSDGMAEMGGVDMMILQKALRQRLVAQEEETRNESFDALIELTFLGSCRVI